MGPARIACLLGLHPSTVHQVLTRYRLAWLRWLYRATARVVRRHEHDHPGDLVHLDAKKLGKIPVGGGWRMLGRTVGYRNSQADKSSGVLNRHNNPVRGRESQEDLAPTPAMAAPRPRPVRPEQDADCSHIVGRSGSEPRQGGPQTASVEHAAKTGGLRGARTEK